MKHPYYDMTTEKALSLARNLLYGPLPAPCAPTPSRKDAIKVLHDELGMCGHTWITGFAALEVLRAEDEADSRRGQSLLSANL
jgi:hypothetical protein